MTSPELTPSYMVAALEDSDAVSAKLAFFEAVLAAISVRRDLAADALIVARIGLADRFWRVRRAAMRVFGLVIRHDPSFIDAGTVANLTKLAIADEASEGRRTTHRVLVIALEGHAEFSEVVLAAALRGAIDKSWRVRLATQKLLPLIISACPDAALAVLDIARTATSDRHEDVRHEALRVIELVTQAPCKGSTAAGATHPRVSLNRCTEALRRLTLGKRDAGSGDVP